MMIGIVGNYRELQASCSDRAGEGDSHCAQLCQPLTFRPSHDGDDHEGGEVYDDSDDGDDGDKNENDDDAPVQNQSTLLAKV